MEIISETHSEIAEKIKAISGEDYNKCYQCGECTSGCPAADEMDIMPNQLNMLLQTGNFDRVLTSRMVWLCVACFECGTRCPRGIDIARQNMDLFNIWEVASKEEFPTVALVASFRKFTA